MAIYWNFLFEIEFLTSWRKIFSINDNFFVIRILHWFSNKFSCVISNSWSRYSKRNIERKWWCIFYICNFCRYQQVFVMIFGNCPLMSFWFKMNVVTHIRIKFHVTYLASKICFFLPILMINFNFHDFSEKKSLVKKLCNSWCVRVSGSGNTEQHYILGPCLGRNSGNTHRCSNAVISAVLPAFGPTECAERRTSTVGRNTTRVNAIQLGNTDSDRRS